MYDTLKKNLVKDKKYNKYYLFKPYTNENCFAFSPKVIVLLEFHKLVFINIKTALLTTDHEKKYYRIFGFTNVHKKQSFHASPLLLQINVANCHKSQHKMENS